MDTVPVTRSFHWFPVESKAAATLAAHHDALFGDDKTMDSSPLCMVMKDIYGAAIPGCHTAAAFTHWTLTLPPAVYDVHTGVKVPRAERVIAVHVRTGMPRWVEFDRASAEDQAEVRRFELMTAKHERGHGVAGETVALCMTNFLDALPEKVPANAAAAWNAAALAILTNFYHAQSREADRAYDTLSGHGGSQGAEAVRKKGLGTALDFDGTGAPRPPLANAIPSVSRLLKTDIVPGMRKRLRDVQQWRRPVPAAKGSD